MNARPPLQVQTSVKRGLTAFCEREFGAAPEGLCRLTGGANMEIWAFECKTRPLILRRYPDGHATAMEAGGISLAAEAALVAKVQQAGVCAPEIIGLLRPDDGIGEGYVMSRMEGEALPYKLFKDPLYAVALEQFVPDCARELAKIHAVPKGELPPSLPSQTAAQAVFLLEKALNDLGARSPVFALALYWLQTHLPDDAQTPAVLLHGDFRMGNLLVAEKGLSAVLDWELAHIGDPAEDLAWLCMPSWRFGNYDRPVGGVGQIDDLLREYAAQSGRAIMPDRLRFWVIYSTLRWGMMTLMMTQMWREGTDRSVERILIGTRMSETEIDLLLQLEDAVGVKASTAFPDPPAPSGLGAEPEAEELLQALGEWTSGVLIPALSGAEKFSARVAGNALGVAERMLRLGPAHAAAQSARMDDLRISEARLFEGLGCGRYDLKMPKVLTYLRLRAIERLVVHQPKYAGLAAARKKWEE